jgi:hypothetical protein
LADIIYWAEQGNTARLKVYLNNSVTTEQWIKPSTPLGGEFYCHGSVQFIKWISRVASGNTATVNLELSTTGSAGPYTTVAANLPNNGTYQWTVPGLFSNNCFLRYTLNTGTGSTTAVNTLPFTIDTCGGTIIIPGPVSGSIDICAGSSQTYMVPQVLNNTGYTWTLPNGWTGSSNSNIINLTAGTQSGVISVIAHFANGNSAPLSLYITVNLLDTSVTQSGITLTALENATSYQWMDCNSGLIINGAVGQSYTPVQNGNYAVIITLGSCVDTSACHPVIVTGLEDPASDPVVLIQPNPATTNILIRSSQMLEIVEVYSVLGSRLIRNEPESGSLNLDISALPAGLYFLKLKSGSRIVFKQFIKANPESF